ncbi:hypothetical protein DO72_4398 [Burkholderia pseudomallei]|nr:hypothetical protein DO72_4398 [Burkholderia pseudomallei]
MGPFIGPFIGPHIGPHIAPTRFAGPEPWRRARAGGWREASIRLRPALASSSHAISRRTSLGPGDAGLAERGIVARPHPARNKKTVRYREVSHRYAPLAAA